MRVSESEITGCPYTFRKARFMMPLLRGFWVSFYCIYDGTSLTHCFNQSDWVDNAQLARELGYQVTTFIHDILVTKDNYPDIFNTIMEYVPRSYFD